jgi:hypothetical protein
VTGDEQPACDLLYVCDPRLSPVVTSLSLIGSTLYMGGRFHVVAGTPRRYAAAVDVADGSLTAWNPSPDVAVTVRGGDSSVALIGEFSLLRSVGRGGLAAFDARRMRLQPFDVPTDGVVDALALRGRQLYLGGQFGALGGLPRVGLAAVDLGTGQVSSWHPMLDGRVSAVAISHGVLYAGGAFTIVDNTPRANLAAFSLKTGKLLPFNPSPDGPISALAVAGRTLYVAGAFQWIGGRRRAELAAVDTATGRVLHNQWRIVGDYQPLDPTGVIGRMAVAGRRLYIAGALLRVNGRVRRGVAAIDQETGRVLPWNAHLRGDVNALALLHGYVYLGGNFYKAGAHPRPGLAALSATTGHVAAWPGTQPSAVKDLLTTDGVDVLTVIGGHLFGAGFNWWSRLR